MKNSPISRRQILGEKRPMSNAKRLFSMNLNKENIDHYTVDHKIENNEFESENRKAIETYEQSLKRNQKKADKENQMPI